MFSYFLLTIILYLDNQIVKNMLEEELLYVLALQRVKGIGDINAKKLISHCGSAKMALTEKRKNLEKINGIGSFILKNLFDSKNLKAAEDRKSVV